MTRRFLAIRFGLGVVVLLGCGARRPEIPSAELHERRLAFARARTEFIAERTRRFLRRMELEATSEDSANPSFDILALHGGGPAGAFAAGFLAGWGSVDDPQLARPVFDVVTGSSSGALAAPFAFVGTSEAYDRLVELYCGALERIARPHPLGLWPTRSALFDDRGLVELIREEVNESLLDGIARGAREERSLYVATTNLDLGLARLWSLHEEIAGDRGAAKERIREVLQASAALPLVFPPVEIDGELHADGGIAASIFPGFDARDLLAVAHEWSARHPDEPLPPIRVWAIVNQKLFTPSRIVQPHYLDIGLRSVEVMMEYDRFKALLYIADMIELLDRREHVDATFYWVAIPEEAPMPDLIDLARADAVHGLVEIGARMGARPESWHRGQPRFERTPESLRVPPPSPQVPDSHLCASASAARRER